MKFLIYLIIGAFDTLVDIGVLSTLLYLFGDTPTNILLFNPLSFSVSVTCSFFLNGKFTFKDNNLTFKKYSKLYASSAVGMFLNTLIVYGITVSLNPNIVLTKIIAACIVVFYNYTMCRKFIFRSKNENITNTTKVQNTSNNSSAWTRIFSKFFKTR